MHNAARGTLAIGGIFTIIGVIVFALGIGTAASAFDLEDDAALIGSSGPFSSTSDNVGFEFFVKGEISVSECEEISVTIRDSTGSEEDSFWGSYYDPDCSSEYQSHDYEGYTFIGFFSWVHEDGVYNVDANREVIVVDTTENAGTAVAGGLVALCGLPAAGCGIMFLLIGGVLGLTLKDKQNVQIAGASPVSTVVQTEF